jgi:hypothetical protein
LLIFFHPQYLNSLLAHPKAQTDPVTIFYDFSFLIGVRRGQQKQRVFHFVSEQRIDVLENITRGV